MAIDRDTVHEALECLYSDPELSVSRLSRQLPQIGGIADPGSRAEWLRSLLLEAIEALYPKRRVAFGSLESRAYDVLTLRYVENMPIAGIEKELSVGKRQVFRDLEEAETRLAGLLEVWAQSGHGTAAGTTEHAGVRPEGHDLLSHELLALASDPGQVKLGSIVAEAVALVAPLAQQRRVRLAPAAIDESQYVLADRALSRQVLVQLLSLAAQNALSEVSISVAEAGEDSEPLTDIVISFAGSLKSAQTSASAESQPPLDRRLEVPMRVAASQGMHCQVREPAPGFTEIRLGLHSGLPVSVLVVEDNPGAVELYRRYLSSRSWQLHGLSDPRLTYEVARKMRPDVIVLDIMMPRLDGWSVLHMLRHQPETARLPVLVCSVVDDPGLALSLGADAYATKPVSQGEFLSALQRCLAKRPQGAKDTAEA